MKPYYSDKWVTIYHGDCREVLPQLDCKVDLVLTDPPYGVGAWYSDEQDDSRSDYWVWLNDIILTCLILSPKMCMTHKVEALKHIFNWDWVGIWNKPFSAGCRAGNSPIVPHYEPIFMWGIHKIGVRGEGFSDVFSFNPTGNGQTKGEHGRVALSTKTEGHKFPKPPSLLSSLIKVMGIDSIKIICDPFLGTGTTCHISKSLNIQSVGIEIEEKYCEIAAKRCSQEVMELSL